MSFLEPLFFFALALSLLVLVHEWGHYFVARRAGVRVLRFSIGFGPEVFGVTRGDTRYSISAIPFGGYVKFAGDNPEEDRAGAADEFLSQPVGIRSAIVLAGPVMNYVLAVLLYASVFYFEGVRVYGPPRIGAVADGSVAEGIGVRPDDLILSVNDVPVADWLELDRELASVSAGQSFELEVDRGGETLRLAGTASEEAGSDGSFFGVYYLVEPAIGGVQRRSPAWEAGLRRGDRIVSVDGIGIDRWSRLQELISERPDREVEIVWERDGEELRGVVTPAGETVRMAEGEEKTVGRIGILQGTEREKVGAVASLVGGWNETWNLTRSVLRFLPKVPVLLVKGLRGEDEGGLGGPVRMAQLFGEAARWGLLVFISWLAFISTQLAIFNLLPIPVLDGGHLALYTAEVITRRPPSARLRIVLQQIGFAILILLMLTVTVVDVGRFFG